MGAKLVTQLGLAAYVLVAALALWRGDRPVRLAASGLLVLAFLANPLDRLLGARVGPDPVLFLLDLLALFLLGGLALRTGHGWALAAAAFQLLGLLTHVAMVTGVAHERAYLTVYMGWGYAALLAVAVGIVLRRPPAN